MDIDYKAIFDQDVLPKLILQQDGKDYLCVTANKKARESFPQQDFANAFRITDLIPEFNPDQNSFCQYALKKLSYDNKLYELTLKAEDQQFSDDEVTILSSVFESSDIGIVITDEEGVIVRLNKGFSRLFGWQKDKVLNRPFHEFIAEEDRERTLQNYKNFIQKGIRSSGEVKMINASNSVSETLCTLNVITLEDGKKYQVTTIIDITFRKRMEKSLRQAKEEAESSNRAKSSFLANMSHELRTPLNAIIGFSELLISEMFGPMGNEKYSEYTNDIHNSACHLLEIINEILDMSKIEAGNIKLMQNEVLLSEVIKTVTRMLKPHVQEKEIEISVQLPEKVPAIKVDSRLLRQALINIVSNAIKYSGQKSDIQIYSEFKANEDLSIFIKDSGQGIPKNKLEHVLKPFGRVEDAFKKKSDVEGTGLGLPIAKGMIELHGGQLFIQSEEGKGTQVEIVIPAYRIIKNNAGSPKKFKFTPPPSKPKENSAPVAP